MSSAVEVDQTTERPNHGEAEGNGKSPVRSLSLLGFYYNTSYDRIRFASVPASSRPPNYSTGALFHHRVIREKKFDDSLLSALNASNGLFLMYFSSFLKKCSVFRVLNPITSESFSVSPPPAVHGYCIRKNIRKKFVVHGFAFEPYAALPKFTIVELTDVVIPWGEGQGLMVRKYVSLNQKWEWKIHDEIMPSLGKNSMLFGPSTFHNGALHWLLVPSGVIAYDIQTESFSFSLMNIPGDKVHIDELGLCNCIRTMTQKDAGGGSGSCGGGDMRYVCNCRYLGESRDHLVYVRVTGDSEFSLWILVDYTGGVWSQSYRVYVDNLPASLFCGRVLAFERNADVVFLRVQRTTFSYNYVSRELKKVFKIKKCYVGSGNCDGLIVPYELPTFDPPFIPGNLFKASCSSSGDILNTNPATTSNSNQANASPVSLYCHYAITQLAVKLFPDLYSQGTDATKLPFQSLINLRGPVSLASFRDASFRYSHLIRHEASLYGCISGCSNRNG